MDLEDIEDVVEVVVNLPGTIIESVSDAIEGLFDGE